MSAHRESLLVTTIPLRSLRCRACSYRLLRALRRTDGVIDARIEALPSAAIVTHERSVPPWRLTESLRAAGADPAAAELALPVATPAGAEEAARRIEIELTALDGVDGAAVDLARHEVRAIYQPGTVGADAIRDRIAAFGWGPAHPAPAAGSADPAQKVAARTAIRRALAATLAASAVTVLGALTGPGALAPFLQLIPDAAAALRRSIPIAPAPALWLVVAISFAALAWCGQDLFRKAARDVAARVATGRALGALAIVELALASTWGAAMAVLGRPAPPLLFGVMLWSLAALLTGHALTLTRGVRRRNGDASLEPYLRETMAAAAWHRGAGEERSLSFARWWGVASIVAGVIAGFAWMAGAGWSVAALASAAVLLAAAPAAFIAAAAMPVRGSIQDLARNGIAILGGETLDRVRSVGTVATNVRGGVCQTRARIAELLLLQGASVEDLLGAAAAAAPAAHPLSQLIRERAGSSRGTAANPGIGTIEEMSRRGIATDSIAEEVSRFESEGKSVLAVADGARLLGALTIAFDERPAASATVAWLNQRAVRTVLLTRNAEGTAAALASRFGFSAFEGGVADPFDSPLLGESGSRAWVSDPEDGLSLGRADVAIAFAPAAERTEREDAVVTTGSLESLRTLMVAADEAKKSAGSRNRWLLAYHLLALPVAGGALLPFTGLLPAPFLAAVGSVIALSLASSAGKRAR